MQDRIIPHSRYLSFFKSNQSWLSDTLEIPGDTMIIERLAFPERRTASGLIIADTKHSSMVGLTSEMPHFYRVLYAGAGYYDDDTKESLPLEINTGDIIHTAAGSVKLWSSFPVLEVTDSDVLGITRHGDILMRWKSEDAFLEFLARFNREVKAEVEARRESQR